MIETCTKTIRWLFFGITVSVCAFFSFIRHILLFCFFFIWRFFTVVKFATENDYNLMKMFFRSGCWNCGKSVKSISILHTHTHTSHTGTVVVAYIYSVEYRNQPLTSTTSTTTTQILNQIYEQFGGGWRVRENEYGICCVRITDLALDRPMPIAHIVMLTYAFMKYLCRLCQNLNEYNIKKCVARTETDLFFVLFLFLFISIYVQ